MQGKSDPNRELLDAVALCRQLVPEGSVEAFLADHRQELFPDELFADLFPSGRGRPSIPADVIATVMVLQSLEGLSDREAVRALRDRISWNATGLALDDVGFDYSVLTYWRTRLRDSAQPEADLRGRAGRDRRHRHPQGPKRGGPRLDLLDDAVATQDTVTQLVSAIRRVRRLIPVAAAVEVSAQDYEQATKPLIAWDDPMAKQALVSALVNDALAISPRWSASSSAPSRPMPSACWPSSPAKTWSRAIPTARGGSPSGWRRTGSSPPCSGLAVPLIVS